LEVTHQVSFEKIKLIYFLKINKIRPPGQTIYQINQRLSVALQRGVGEQLIACECAS
jgi:hypothetical protein